MGAELKDIIPISFLKKKKSPIVDGNIDRISIIVIDKKHLSQSGHVPWDLKGKGRISFVYFSIIFLMKRGYV